MAHPNSVRDLLDRLQCWLEKHRPRYLSGLNPPATCADLSDLEAELGRPVPADLKSLLRWHNGQAKGFSGAFENAWLFMSCADIAAATSNADCPAGWIPFLDNDAGDFLCLDSAAAVRAFCLGNSDHPVVAACLDDWLADFVSHVEKGHYVEEPERGHFLLSSS